MSVLDALPDGITGIDTHMGGASEITAGFLVAGERPALIETGPAKVAGVGEVIMAVPAPGGEIEPIVLSAAGIAGVDRVFTIGGAQAIAALAYGTETVPSVDKIVGPGNRYVAAAKAMVFGQVGIDLIAGPSEVVIVCDGTAPVEWVTMDLFAQAEHDEQAQAILLCPDPDFIEAVARCIARELPGMERASGCFCSFWKPS